MQPCFHSFKGSVSQPNRFTQIKFIIAKYELSTCTVSNQSPENGANWRQEGYPAVKWGIARA